MFNHLHHDNQPLDNGCYNKDHRYVSYNKKNNDAAAQPASEAVANRYSSLFVVKDLIERKKKMEERIRREERVANDAERWKSWEER